ncbi:hypothetical protein QQ045_030668 [Rhodiola kirilowii]
MEGLLPYVYKTLVQYKNGNGAHIGNESPSYSYVKLHGESGRFHSSDYQVFQSDIGSPASVNLKGGSAPSHSVSLGHAPTRRGAARHELK